MTIHPRHEEARYAMAQRLARFFYDNRFGSDWVALAGDRFWDRVPKTAGEKRTPSPETRHLTLEMLKDLEAKGAPRGPSLAEIEEAKVSEGVSRSPRPAPDNSNEPLTGPPSDLSEAPADNPGSHAALARQAVSSESSAVSVVASEDAPGRVRTLSAGPTGQASLPFQPHSETSRQAAHDPVTKDVAAAHRLLVLQTLREYGPLTDDQIADHLGLTTEQVRVRRIGLMHDRIVEQAGRGLSRKGRPCNTWGLTEFAVSA